MRVSSGSLPDPAIPAGKKATTPWALVHGRLARTLPHLINIRWTHEDEQDNACLIFWGTLGHTGNFSCHPEKPPPRPRSGVSLQEGKAHWMTGRDVGACTIILCWVPVGREGPWVSELL